MWIIPLLALVCGIYALWQNLPIATLFWPSVLLGGLLFLTAAQAKPETRLRNISGLCLIAAFTISLAALLAQNGLPLVGVELALVVSALALLVGWALKSTSSVLLSTFSSLLYLSSSFPELGLTTGLTDDVSQLGAGLMPWIILGQVTLARRIRSSIVLLTAIIAGYIWFGTLTKSMPLTALTGVIFAVAAAHYWLGKAWAETDKFGANIHRTCAWVVAIAAALYVQSIWMRVDAGQAKPFWPPNTLWWAVLSIAMFALFLASLMRYKTSHITLSGIFIVWMVVATLPLAAAKPDLIYALFDAVPGLNARPGFGLIIGAIIIAAGFIWLLNGLRRGHLMEMYIGAGAIAIEAMILFQPSRFDTDLGVIFLVSLICALCVGGLIAGTSHDRSDPRRNYA